MSTCQQAVESSCSAGPSALDRCETRPTRKSRPFLCRVSTEASKNQDPRYPGWLQIWRVGCQAPTYCLRPTTPATAISRRWRAPSPPRRDRSEKGGSLWRSASCTSTPHSTLPCLFQCGETCHAAHQAQLRHTRGARCRQRGPWVKQPVRDCFTSKPEETASHRRPVAAFSLFPTVLAGNGRRLPPTICLSRSQETDRFSNHL